MHYQLWKTTGILKPFNTVEEFEQFEKDLFESPDPLIKKAAPKGRSNIKRGYYHGNKYDSFAEFTFCSYMEKVMLYNVERNERQNFLLYLDENGKSRKYYPDFIVNGGYCEVKGRMRPKDELKRRQHPEVVWYFQPEINEMAKVLDEKFPGWRDEFIQTNITK
ncbi:MAG: hypothetical protein HUJ68_06695 [Clostridia bacterium]|nr:hypothetical protein [Clostridia bacterium]